MSDLQDALQRERLASYAKLKGGFPVMLGGATYWGVLAAIGYVAPEYWQIVALFGSGAIFPFALMWAAIFRNDFMKERTSVSSVLLPTFVSMLLFWPMAIAALWEAPGVFPLILAVGLSLHFPVIGWSYGRTLLYCAHAVIRAIVVFMVWWKLPDERLTLLPLIVVAAYLLTVAIVIVDSAGVRRKLAA